MKGVRWRRVLWRHVFRNSVLAVVAVYGVNLAYLISGTVLVENVSRYRAWAPCWSTRYRPATTRWCRA